MKNKILKKLIMGFLISTYASGAFLGSYSSASGGGTPNYNDLPADKSNQIKGYTNSPTVQYRMVYSFEDMTFFYNKGGQYDPNTGDYQTGFTDANMVNFPESSVGNNTPQKEVTGAWYGFDGLNNRILIGNCSNSKVYAKVDYAPQLSFESIDLKLYMGEKDKVGNLDDSNNANFFTESSGLQANTCDLNKRFGENTAGDKLSLNLKSYIEFNAAPGNKQFEYRDIYVDLNGTPGNDLSADKDAASTIGTLTISLSMDGKDIETPPIT